MNPAYNNYDQKDSGEFLNNLLIYLGKELNRNLEKITLPKPKIDQGNKKAVQKLAKEEMDNKEDHIIFEIFSSQSLRANNCNKCGVLYDSSISNMWTLSIPCTFEKSSKHDIVSF